MGGWPNVRGVRGIGNHRMRRSNLGVVVVVLLVVVAFVAVAFADPSIFNLSAGGGGGSQGDNGTAGPGTSVAYTSSVDGAQLSYDIWNPPGFTSAGTYPFLLFLHGVESTNECSNVPDYAGGASMITAANGAGWVVGSLCTRVTDGWYVNSPTTGPEETDVLDAIAHEKTLTQVSGVYLVGMSMGGAGALSIATNNPSLFSGVAAVATCADMYEESSYYLHAHGSLPPGFADVSGSAADQLPAAGSVGAALEQHLSAFRFYPQNLSGVRMYLTAGGADQTCIDNTAFWPWMQANNTVLTSSCNVASDGSEPADCSTPIATLAAAHSGEFLCRFVYEPTAPHTFDQLNGGDLLDFFLGKVPTGTYSASLGGDPTPTSGVPQA
jgi:S-formylglutathione hydrolase FrmB